MLIVNGSMCLGNFVVYLLYVKAHISIVMFKFFVIGGFEITYNFDIFDYCFIVICGY